MKRINFLFVTLLSFLFVNAQTISEADTQLLDKIKAANTKTHSVQSDFSQVKHISILGEDIVSNGKLYYVKPDKMAMEYDNPKGDLMIINGDRFIMVMSGKRNETTAKASAKMQGIKTILTASFEGDVRRMETEKITCEETSQYYIATIDLVKGKTNKSGIERVVVTYDKKDYSLSALRMNEKDGTYTTYELMNKKFDQPVDDAMFQ